MALLGTGSYFIQQPEVLLWWDIPEEMMGHLKDDQSVPRPEIYDLKVARQPRFGCVTESRSHVLMTSYELFMHMTYESPLDFISKSRPRPISIDFEVVYAALGPEQQYFLRFRDGDTCWSLWSELSQQIKAQEQRSHRVSYATRKPMKHSKSFYRLHPYSISLHIYAEFL